MESPHDCSQHDSCIHRVPVFQHLSEADLVAIEHIVTSAAYAKGSFVFREGEPSDSLFIVREGLVKLSQTSEQGKEHIVRFLFPGDFFGQFALLQEKHHDTDAEVIDGGRICQIRRDQFKKLLQQSNEMAYRFLLAMSELLHQAEQWAGAMHIMDVEQRVAKLLLYYNQKHNEKGHFLWPAPQKEMAAMIGTTAETFSRRMASLKQIGIIETRGRRIHVKDAARLAELAHKI